MIICSYYEDLAKPDDAVLIDLWKRAWRRLGYSVCVLDHFHAQKHSRFFDLLKKAGDLPTVNHRGYETACYMRWLAASRFAMNAGKIVFMDYDVFPADNWEGWPAQSFFAHFGHPSGCVTGRSKDFEKVVDAFFEHQPSPECVHVSDMTILVKRQDIFDTRFDWISNYGLPKWQDKAMIHFGNEYVPKDRLRSQFVSQILS